MFAPSLALGNSDILCACACVFSGENKKTGACTPTHQVQAHSHLALAPLDKPGALATIPDPARACHGPLIHSSHVACLLGRARLLGPPGSDHSPACEKASALCPPNPVAAGRCPVPAARPHCQTRWHKTEDRTRRCRASSALAASTRDHGGLFLRATVVGFCVALLHPLARISRLSCTSHTVCGCGCTPARGENAARRTSSAGFRSGELGGCQNQYGRVRVLVRLPSAIATAHVPTHHPLQPKSSILSRARNLQGR